jgi:8-oxo-dGTP diphosphatase
VNIDEDLPDAARRELAEETGLAPIWIEQFYCFGTPGRDPRGRTISVAYLARVDPAQTGRAADDAAELRWFDVDDLPTLAFDHDRIIDKAQRMLADWQKLGRIE